jgi:hypothetical protein
MKRHLLLRKLHPSAALALAACLALPMHVMAQSSMKSKEDSGGGIPSGSTPQKSRPKCSPSLATGAAGPIAKAVWQVPSPGKVNFCVNAGVQGNYLVATKAGLVGTTATPSTQRLAQSGATTMLPITFTLRDRRQPHVWEREWAPGQPGDEAPLSIDQTSWVAHAALKFSTADMSEPQAPNLSANLPNAWCVNDLKWSRRPYLVVELSGPGVRGHTDRSETSCSIEFGAAEAPTANLQALIGAPAFPNATPSTATPTKPVPSKSKTP